MDKCPSSSPQLVPVPSSANKPEAVLELVREVVRMTAPVSQLPKVGTFCRELRISPNTLDKVYARLESEGLVDRRKGVGIFASEGAPRQVLRVALLGDPSLFQAGNRSPVWDLLVRRSGERALAGGEDFEFHFALPGDRPLHHNLLEDIQRHRVHGVISVGLQEPASDWIEDNLTSLVPVVSMFHRGRWMVRYDDAAFVEMGVEALQSRGSRRLAFWRGVAPHRNLSHQEGLFYSVAKSSFVKAVAHHGLIFEPNLYCNNRHLIEPPEGSTTVTMLEQGFATAASVFDGPRDSWPDGILIEDDMFARGALVAMQKKGIHPGRDIQIVTHANKGSDVLLGHETDLMLLEYDPDQAVAILFDALEALMRGETPPLAARDEETSNHSIAIIKPQLRL